MFTVVGALVLYYVFKGFNTDDFLAQLEESNKFYVFLSVSLGVVAVLIRAMRWRILLKPLGFNAKLSNAYHSCMSGYLVNLGIPRAGELSRCALLSKSDNIPANILIGTVVTERIIDVLMLGLVLALSLVLQFDLLFNFVNVNLLIPISQKLSFNVILITVLIILAIIFSYKAYKKKRPVKTKSNKLKEFFAGFSNGLNSITKLQQPILFIVYSIGIWVCYFLMTFFILKAFVFTEMLGVGAALSTLVFSSIGVIIPAPAGTATMATVSKGLEEIYALTHQQSDAVGIVLFFSNVIMILLAGTVSFIIMAYKTRTSNAPSKNI
ncbi:MAG: flippase-like domain-containing protein [Bacteroidia bacterium]|nr:flippase-like domain-containing protein [Bacteroidia bacterium]